MKKLLLVLAIVLALPVMAHAQQGGQWSGSTSLGNPSIGDPCLSFKHASVPVAAASATTTKVLAGVASQTTYVCGLGGAIVSGGTAQLIAGTGTNCGTNSVNLTGVMPAQTLTPDTPTSSIIVAPLGADICVVGTGAGAPIGGYMTYVQSPR